MSADPLCPVHEDRGQLMDFMGREFYPFDPRPEDIRLDEIATILSVTRRYTGQSAVSVAQHSVIVADLLTDEGCCNVYEELDGLLHDAHEAYLGDIARPLKRNMLLKFNGSLLSYDAVSDRLDVAIYQKLWPKHFPSFVSVRTGALKIADDIAALWEARDVLQTHLPWTRNHPYTIPNEQLVAWGSAKAKERFLERYKGLCK